MAECKAEKTREVGVWSRLSRIERWIFVCEG